MPHDPVTVRSHVLQEHGMHDMIVTEKYEAPASDDGGVAFDVHKDFDLWRARRVMALLKTHYYGHLWCVESDVKQGLVKISIPILMGIGWWYIINLSRTELTPKTVLAAGGEILERYKLSRGRFELGAFLDARAKHSPLVNIGRVRIPT